MRPSPIPPCAAVRAAPLLVGLACLPAHAAGQAESLGPLVAEEGSPLHRVSLTPVFEHADLLEPGALEIGSWLGWANVFEQDSTGTHVLILDFERLIATATLRVGVVDGVEAGVRLTTETTGGGVLDGLVSGWHQRLGLGNANRDRVPRDGYSQQLVDGEGRIRLDVPRRTLAVEDLRIFAKWRLAADGVRGRALSVRAVLRVPTQDNRVGRELADVGLFALGRVRWRGLHLHGMVGGSTLRASEDLRGMLAESAWTAALAAERPFSDRLSAIVQASLSSPKLRGFEGTELDTPASTVVFGLAGRVGEAWQWEASFQEDIPPDTPAIDFTLGFGLRRSF